MEDEAEVEGANIGVTSDATPAIELIALFDSSVDHQL